MFFWIIFILSILIPLIMNNKDRGLTLSLCLLFILWGLQYKVVNDWDANLFRWITINENRNFIAREIEYVYTLILKFCRPLTFFGFLMFSAFLELKTIHYFTKRYVVPDSYWITIFILMSRINLGLLMINSNRQSFALLVTMYASLFLIKIVDKNKLSVAFNYLAALFLIYISINIHKGAALSFLLLTFPLCIHYLNRINKWYILLIFSLPFFAKFFINISDYVNWVSNYIQASSLSRGFEHYGTEFNSNAGFSIFEQFFNYMIIICVALFFHHLSKAEKFFGLSVVFATIVQGYLTDTLLRTMQYFQIYTIFLIPNLINHINCIFGISCNKGYITLRYKANVKLKKYSLFVKIVYFAAIAFCVLSLIKYIYIVDFDTWHGWRNFKTIFESPKWI